MSTLADRLQKALDAKPGASQADLARHCKARGPSVSDWFTGETKTLKAKSIVLAAEFLEVRARWLLDGVGPMRLAGHAAKPSDQQVPPAVSAPPPPDLAEQIVELVAGLPPARWRSIRAQLDSLAGEPAMRDDVLGEVRALLADSGKPRRAG